jgi:glyoxylase-like metal-dependent hydrolase (beta-lactamase superfamily II)
LRETALGQRAAWLAKSLPAVESLTAGVWSIPVPIPESALRYTLCYALPASGGVVLVDPGWDSDEGWDALTEGLGRVGVTVADVVGVLLTHVHPDHHGLTRRVVAASGAWIAMHSVERDSLPSHRWLADGLGPRNDERFLLANGVPRELLDTMLSSATTMERLAQLVEPTLLLEEGDRVPSCELVVRVIWTPGHTPGHVCLYEEGNGRLFTGDHLLPHITPNIGLRPQGPQAPLTDYLNSLTATAAFVDVEALPGHEYRFTDIPARTAELIRHHDERCAEVARVVANLGDASAWQVAQHLSWSRGWDSLTMTRLRRTALGETGAHLRLLASQGRLRRSFEGLDRVETYQPTANQSGQ